MVDKSMIQRLEGGLDTEGLIIPCDYVIMKNTFKKELLERYFKPLQKGQTILDLNPGTEGIWKEIDLSEVQYLALEQNPYVRSLLEDHNISVMDWKVPRIPLPDGSVDYALSTPFIEHLPTYVDAINFLIEVRRILRPGGKILLIVPNYLSQKEIFFEDYKHGWVTTKKRIKDMLLDCHYEILGCRYTIGWITMRMNPLTAFLRFWISIVFAMLRLNIVERLMEFFKLDILGNKIKKTFFELIVVEARIGNKKEVDE